MSSGRILVIEEDCARLASLMLWLGHYDGYEVKGTVFQQDKDFAKFSAFRPDVVLINDAAFKTSDSVKNLTQTIDQCFGNVVVRTASATNGEPKPLMKEDKHFKAQFSDKTPLTELKEKIEQLLSAQQPTTRIVMAKAG